MDEYIERERILDVIAEGHSKRNEEREVEALAIWDSIKKIPTADVAPVRHGEWVPGKVRDNWGDEMDWFVCSHCGAEADGRCVYDEFYSAPVFSNYCSNCGAKMDGKGDHSDDI